MKEEWERMMKKVGKKICIQCEKNKCLTYNKLCEKCRNNEHLDYYGNISYKLKTNKEEWERMKTKEEIDLDSICEWCGVNINKEECNEIQHYLNR